MKRLFVFWIILLAVQASGLPTAPALAQASPIDPAAYLPSDTSAYLEVRSDADGLTALNQLVNLSSALSGRPSAPQGDLIDAQLNPFLSLALPGIDVRTDILPWLGDRVGVGMIIAASHPTVQEGVIVLPIRDPNGAQAFVTRFTAGATSESVGGAMVYKTDTLGLAVGSNVIWLSAPRGIDALLETPLLEHLTDNAHYQAVRAALPLDAVLYVYVSGEFPTSTLPQSEETPANLAKLRTLLEAALRLHPAQSPMEDALLQFPPLNGIGFALQLDADRLNATGVLSLDAHYPAPTLANATAGTALLSLIPGDSFAVFDSYDVSAMALPLASYFSIGSAVGGTFASLSASLDGTPPPTPIPTPTPPPLTVDGIIAQAQPIIAQAESLLGLSLDELYSLTNGEYAVAVFPGPGPTIGAALYLKSSDPQRLIDTVSRVSRLILTDPTNGTPLVAVEYQMVDGVDVALLGVPGANERPAIGVLNGSVLFVTTESTVSKVIASASSQNPASPALGWRDTFGASQDALLYLDPRMIDLYMLQRQRTPPLPLTAVAGALDIRDDGLFILQLTATLGGS